MNHLPPIGEAPTGMPMARIKRDSDTVPF